MFDDKARLVVCNTRYIEMHLLRRERLRGAMLLVVELLLLRLKTGTFSGDGFPLRRVVPSTGC